MNWRQTARLIGDFATLAEPEEIPSGPDTAKEIILYELRHGPGPKSRLLPERSGAWPGLVFTLA